MAEKPRSQRNIPGGVIKRKKNWWGPYFFGRGPDVITMATPQVHFAARFFSPRLHVHFAGPTFFDGGPYFVLWGPYFFLEGAQLCAVGGPTFFGGGPGLCFGGPAFLVGALI